MNTHLFGTISTDVVKDVTVLLDMLTTTVKLEASFCSPQLRRHEVAMVSLAIRINAAAVPSSVQIMLELTPNTAHPSVVVRHGCELTELTEDALVNEVTRTTANMQRRVTRTVEACTAAALETIVHKVYPELAGMVRQASALAELRGRQTV